MPSTIATTAAKSVPEWFVSSLMMDRVSSGGAPGQDLDRAHDIPYLAGYSRDGKTIYIDRHMPRTMKFHGRDIDRPLPDPAEEVEKTLIDQWACTI